VRPGNEQHGNTVRAAATATIHKGNSTLSSTVVELPQARGGQAARQATTIPCHTHGSLTAIDTTEPERCAHHSAHPTGSWAEKHHDATTRWPTRAY